MSCGMSCMSRERIFYPLKLLLQATCTVHAVSCAEAFPRRDGRAPPRLPPIPRAPLRRSWSQETPIL